MKEFVLKYIFVLVVTSVFIYNSNLEIGPIKIEVTHKIKDRIRLEHDSVGYSGFEIKIK